MLRYKFLPRSINQKGIDYNIQDYPKKVIMEVLLIPWSNYICLY